VIGGMPHATRHLARISANPQSEGLTQRPGLPGYARRCQRLARLRATSPGASRWPPVATLIWSTKSHSHRPFATGLLTLCPDICHEIPHGIRPRSCLSRETAFYACAGRLCAQGSNYPNSGYHKHRRYWCWDSFQYWVQPAR
jgi:hypothetical protein